ncbi:MAG: sulfatase-like hydrolase/transferase, partial [Candidatus Latescibacteria bacterium]|nr:sulfatase-like hydrolase/transferase [Candidatus Latescibacterota bacterium]
DDQGYADVGYHGHCKDVDTPHTDQLAAAGAQFTDGYASAYVCAPTRAGLLTGRYQQRFGFYKAADSRVGLPADEITIADLLQTAGYRTGIFGKWHLGLDPEYHPLKRGFDEFYGFLGHGAHDYFDLESKADQPHNAMYRNETIINDTGYLTDNLGREAVSFIEKNHEDPFFLYLPFNAVHWPLQAPQDDIACYNTDNPDRNIQLAMVKRMDIAIGAVIDALKKTGVWDNTLLFFFSDNGGAQKNHADNTPLRDYKHSVYEGGLRVPFIVTWPGHIEAGSTCNEPVISLDLLPTICAATGTALPNDRIYDGRDLLPTLQQKTNEPVHQNLFFDGDDGYWSIRSENWKLVFNQKEELELYNLADDIGETQNIADQHQQKVHDLHDAYQAWHNEMAPRITHPN